ncbi:MAG: helix-turn-helix transcriptional regulator [Burkholderiales bacterium]|nr:helix-turn-helix transcriptional regulator [Burkholderiales bacterium]
MRDEMTDLEITVVAGGAALDAVVVRLRFADRRVLEQLERGQLRDAIELVVSQHLARHAGAAPGGLGPERLERVRVLVERSLDQPLHVEDLAAAAHMSAFHFSRLFKLATGQSPHAYLTQQRVERAKELLAESRLPLVHIASAVGFQTQGHFTEVFRRHTCTTPRRFRLAALAPAARAAPPPSSMAD